MADSLLLKGEGGISKHTGTEMTLVTSRGGRVTKLPRWYSRGGPVQYINCVVLRVKIAGNQLIKLVIPVNPETQLTVKHDGEGNFTFSGYRHITRAAVFPEDSYSPDDLITEYQFPKISAGSVLTRTLGKLPSAPVAPKKVETKEVKKPNTKFEVKVDTTSKKD